jgi:HEAT repeat protein
MLHPMRPRPIAPRTRPARPWLSVVALLSVLNATLLAHGGSYSAPRGAGAGKGASGSMVAAPARKAPANPAGGTGASTGAGAGAATGNQKNLTSGGQPPALTSAGWQYWWEFNKDQYLNLKSRALRLSSKGTAAGHLTGRGRRADPGLFIRPDPARIRGEVLPLFVRLLDEEQDQDILDSSMLALARSSDEETAQFVIDALLPFLAHKDRVVQRAAALALGVLHSPRAVPDLTSLMKDSSKGRVLARATGPLDQSLRACAALGLGLINEPDSVDALCSLIEQTSDSDDDLKACAITALGLMDNEAGSQALTFLLRLLEDRRLDPPIQSHVPPAIGRLCSRMGLFDPVVEAALLKAFGDRDTDDQVRQSLAIALGLVGTIPSDDLGQDAVLTALLDYCREGRDDGTRELCFIAAAQVGRNDTAAPEHPRAHQALRELFVTQCVNPGVAGDRAWAALGAAIYGQVQTEAQPQLAESLIAAYSEEGDPSFQGAFALALGLLDERRRADELFADFNGQQDQELNGFIALALGFLGYDPASETLRTLARAKPILAMYRMRLATALALLADDGTDEALIALLGEGHSVGVNAAAAKALGLIGGTAALTKLAEIAVDPNQAELARAFACVALGMICEKTALPWNARLSADSNFRTLVPTLREVLDIL